VSTGGKVASLERVKRILQTSAPGIPIDALSAPPVGVPSHADELFFRLDPTSPLYEEARNSGDLAIVLRAPLSPKHTSLRVLGLLNGEDA
jgi:predicted component of type VI protein secretion system